MTLIAWLALMALLSLEIAAALLHAGWLAAILAPSMIAVVVLAFMKVRTETPLSRIFAIAGLFWLAILLSLGSLDFRARHSTPAPQTTASATYG